MSEPAPIVPASYGAREAMPAAGFLDKIEALDLDRLIHPITAAHAREDQAAADQINVIAARIFNDPGLRPFLEWILDMTLRQPVFLAGLGDNGKELAILQEGRNQVAWRILQAIARGRDEAPPARTGA